MESSPGKTFIDPVTGMSFILIKGECFKMGSGTGGSEERPVHEVCVDDFYMGEYEVTQAQYEWVMRHNPSSYKRCELPVETVSWKDAQTFIRKLSQASGRNYRLPSEGEWEYAGRRGWKKDTKATVDESLLMEYAGYVRNIGVQDDPFGPNGLGLYGMDGNVWEWVSDWYGSRYYARSPRTNPKGPSSGSYRVLRAGIEVRNEAQFAKRYGAPPDERQNYFGFRLVFPAGSPAGARSEVLKAETSDPAGPGFGDEVPVLKVESASGPPSTQPLL
jgi:formylglycine-generating enzyme required for sulfatase activity